MGEALKYFVRRLLLMIPSFLGITIISFLIVNMSPGGPVEQKIQAIRFGSGAGEGGSGVSSASSRKGSVVSEEVIAALNQQYGFDKPLYECYWIWLRNIIHLDFGDSFAYEEPVISVITSKLPVSLQFGIFSFLITYLISIPMGVFKAIKAGSPFDQFSGLLMYIAYSIPPVVLGVFLIVFFAGGRYFSWFPVGQIHSDNFSDLSLGQQILDRGYHFVLPLLCYVIGGFTDLTMLVRNSMIDVLRQDYIRTARAMGHSRNSVLFFHALKNALLPVVSGMGNFLRLFLAGSLIVETIFQLDGIGLLSYRSIISRDYNVIMGLIFLSSALLLCGRLLVDLLYKHIDPRVDFK